MDLRVPSVSVSGVRLNKKALLKSSRPFYLARDTWHLTPYLASTFAIS
jgi:hypothetical protein